MSKTILLVEDSEDDVILFKLALEQAGIVNPVIDIPSSELAVCYLNGDAPYDDRTIYPLPGNIIVDLQLRGRDGLHLLAWLDHEKRFDDTLVVVLSGYHELKEVRAAYGLGADSFLTKPVHPKDIQNLVRAYPHYWDFKPAESL